MAKKRAVASEASSGVEKPVAKRSSIPDDFIDTMRKRARRAAEYERENVKQAKIDLSFAAGSQWPADVEEKRRKDGRPCLTFDLTMKFVRQITGDMRQSRPAIKVYGVNDHSDTKTAETFAEVIRYIENRSDARTAYAAAVDSQVIAGIGHLEVVTEYAQGAGTRSKVRASKDDDQRLMDIRIQSVPDQIAVLWDPDAVLPGKADADWCFVPVDYEFDTFKEAFPDASAQSFDTVAEYLGGLNLTDDWSSGNRIRVAAYYVRSYDKKTGEASVKRYLVTGAEVLEESEVPCSRIPVIPVVGEEIRTDRSVQRFGVIRKLRPVQQAYNYWMTAQTEVIALQPKAPFVGTVKNFADQPEWWTANNENHPFLAYTPDPLNGGARPQRENPPVASAGFEAAINRMQATMREVTGIYDAALGARSNETSGKAILARQREGDTGTYVYMDNFTRSLTQLGRVLVDMIPRVYDTERTLRIIGEDGAVNKVSINRAVVTPETILNGAGVIFENDLSAGTYDVTVDVGPAYSTMRDEARDGMMQFLQVFPAAAPAIADLVASVQQWPSADKMAKRLRMIAPPAIQQMEQEEAGDNAAPLPARQPSQDEIMQAQAQQQALMAELRAKQADADLKEAQARKALADAAKAEVEAHLLAMTPPDQATQQAVPAIIDDGEDIRLGRELYKARALKELDLEFEMRRRELEMPTQPVEQPMN